MEVAVDGTWVGDGVDVANVPVGVAPVVTGVETGVGALGVDTGVVGVITCVEANVGPGVGVSGACVGTGAKVSGVGDWVVVAQGQGSWPVTP